MVCVMSGCFVQRGEPAILAPHARGEMAVRAGADLVLELPVPWALASAEGTVCRLVNCGGRRERARVRNYASNYALDLVRRKLEGLLEA